MVEIFAHIVTLILTCIIILISASIFYKYIYGPYKINVRNTPLEVLLTILNAAINTELDLYDTDIFGNKGAITNSNFDNFYKDITNAIINNLSDDFFKEISRYITEDAVISIIARKVKQYLTTKVHGTF